MVSGKAGENRRLRRGKKNEEGRRCLDEAASRDLKAQIAGLREAVREAESCPCLRCQLAGCHSPPACIRKAAKRSASSIQLSNETMRKTRG